MRSRETAIMIVMLIALLSLVLIATCPVVQELVGWFIRLCVS